MKLATIDIGVFIAYILVVMGIGLVAAMKSRGGSKRDYFLAGDKLPWWMIGGSIVAANISSHHLIGVIGTAYSTGFVAMVIEWGAVLIGFNALLWIFLPFYLRNGFYTMPEFLQKRFGSAARTTYASLIMVIYVFVEVAAVLYFGAVAVNTLFPNVNVHYCILLVAVATAVYTLTGGLRAVVWTEMLQLCVLLGGGILLSWFTLKAVGGWGWVVENQKHWDVILPANDPSFPWTMYLGGITCISIFYGAANQFIVQRTLAAKDEWHARMGIVFADYLKFLMPLIIVIPGLAAKSLFPNIKSPDATFPTLVENLLPPGIVGLVMAGLVAAIMGHLSGAVNSCTTIATIDFYLPYINPKATDQQSVRFGKTAGAVIFVLGILLANILIQHKDRPVFLILLDAYGYVAPGITTMFLLGILWRRATHAGALCGGAATIPLSFLLKALLPGLSFFNRTGIVFWSCMAIGIGISLITTPKPDSEIEGLIWNKESLRLPPDYKKRITIWNSPFTYWAIVTAAILFFYFRYY